MAGADNTDDDEPPPLDVAGYSARRSKHAATDRWVCSGGKSAHTAGGDVTPMPPPLPPPPVPSDSDHLIDVESQQLATTVHYVKAIGERFWLKQELSQAALAAATSLPATSDSTELDCGSGMNSFW